MDDVQQRIESLQVLYEHRVSRERYPQFLRFLDQIATFPSDLQQRFYDLLKNAIESAIGKGRDYSDHFDARYDCREIKKLAHEHGLQIPKESLEVLTEIVRRGYKGEVFDDLAFFKYPLTNEEIHRARYLLNYAREYDRKFRLGIENKQFDDLEKAVQEREQALLSNKNDANHLIESALHKARTEAEEGFLVRSPRKWLKLATSYITRAGFDVETYHEKIQDIDALIKRNKEEKSRWR